MPTLRERLLAFVLRPVAPPTCLGITVAAVFITAETALVYQLQRDTPTTRSERYSFWVCWSFPPGGLPPIVVDGRVWGGLVIGSARTKPMPPETQTT